MRFGRHSCLFSQTGGKGKTLLQYFRREGYNFHVTLVTQFAGNRAENTGTTWLICVVKQHYCVVIKRDVRPVTTTELILCANDNRLTYSAFLDTTGWQGILYAYDNLIT